MVVTERFAAPLSVKKEVHHEGTELEVKLAKSMELTANCDTQREDRPMRWRRRIRLRFSIRALLLMVLVFAVYLGYQSHRARNQRDAVAFIRDSGGRVFFDYQLDENDFGIINPRLPGPDWLRGLLGDDYFQAIVTDDLNGTDVSDSDLVHLAKIPRIRYLRLARTNVTDKGMEAVRDLSYLESLDISGTQVSDDGLMLLSEMPSLRVIDVAATGVTSDGIARFKKFAPRCVVKR